MNFVLKAVLVTFAALQLVSCSKGNNSVLDASGKHPANWIVNHREVFRSLAGAIDDPAIANKSQCVECHGADLKGGVSKVSCFSQGFGAQSCHFHPAGFANPDSHGTTAKGFGTSLGLRTCQGCHGSLYGGGVLTAISCFPCHGVNAPHAKNWATSTTRLHSSTDSRNAAQCAECHAGGRFLTTIGPPPPQPAGTPPGCFNNTLCHSGLHPAGWIDPAQHGATAKSQPGSDKGFTSCQVCHGTDFAGGSSQVSCFTASRANGACHVRNGVPVNSPHAALPWRGNAPALTHTSTVDDAQGLNAGVCAQCHLRGANLRTQIITSFANGTPGCFNSTLCHGAVGHPVGWADPAQHGFTAKANLTFCQTCHSNNPSGGPGSNPRFNVALGRLVNGCEDCHEPLTAHPPVLQIPAVFGNINNPDPLNTPWFRHRTSTNFDACNRCHGAALDGGVGPRCQACHVAALPTATKDSPDPCSSCHSNPPSGTTYPNINRAHISHAIVNAPTGQLCAECHSGLGSGTLNHFLRAKNIRLGIIIPATQTRAQAGAVVFGGILSRANGAVPTFDLATLQCANTYCHGTTLASNIANPQANYTPTPAWDTPFQGIHCDKCHGFPPLTTSHTLTTGPTSCKNCHAHVNATGTGFDDATKHINGVIDVAHAFPFAGALHKTASNGTGCITAGCHAFGAAGSPYPAATTGAPPNCRGCHLNANPSTDPRCSDCHGSSAADATANAGRPNSTAFPNRQGSGDGHNRGTHTLACTFCHVFSSGDARHGWSNRIKSTNAQMVPALNWNPGTRAAGQGTCNPAAGGINGCHASHTGWY